MPDIVPAGSTVTASMLTYRSPYVVAHASLTSNSGTITSTTEVTIVTTPSATLTAGRAYEFRFQGLVQHATANLTDLLFLRLRLGNGNLIRNFQSVAVSNHSTASRNNALDLAIVCTPAATTTNTVYMTGAWDSGSSATFTFAATSGTPALLTVRDYGPASDMPGIGTF